MISDGEWRPAEFVENTKYPRSYIVRAGSGSEYRRNKEMLLKTQEDPHVINTRARIPVLYPSDIARDFRSHTRNVNTPRSVDVERKLTETSTPVQKEGSGSTPVVHEETTKPEASVSSFGRTRKKPKYLSDYV